MNRLNLSQRTILFLGYGAVAKCVWNHFDRYFTYDPKRVFAVDQFESAFVGPNVEHLQIRVLRVSSTTFDILVGDIGMKAGDIIIDLTYDSCTYFFIRRCLEMGFHYLNTSIEDKFDPMFGTSIDCQQRHVAKIVNLCKERFPIQSNILTECGQNPGMIQHYVFHGLFEMYRMRYQDAVEKNFNIDLMKQTITDYHIGSILFSEIDDQVTEESIKPEVLTNTWSVSGFLTEALDPAELVRGRDNHWIKPPLEKDMLHTEKTKQYRSMQPNAYEVIFLKEMGINVTLPSVCPVWKNGSISYTPFYGKLIHHGEMFDLARLFGGVAPFMTYVYANNVYMDHSIQHYLSTHPGSSNHDLIEYANHAQTFRVLDQAKGQMKGQDSMGATFVCGDNSVERLFWCGSLFSDQDAHHPYFTPTTVQVAAGVLSGLSYILEEAQANRGWFQPSDLDTSYILEKAVPLLGKFFFTELPISSWTEELVCRTKQVI